MKLTTWPTQEVLTEFEKATPDYMHPNKIPFAVIAEGVLPPEQCEYIVSVLDKYPGYNHKNCGAFTREIGHDECLNDIATLAHQINRAFWQYDLDEMPHTWMQTYGPGGNYQMHMDAGQGRMRKSTAVTFLSDENAYVGGDLEVHFHPGKRKIPRTQGTVVMFQPWILHEVLPLTSGLRKTLNMSFWGPNFR